MQAFEFHLLVKLIEKENKKLKLKIHLSHFIELKLITY